MLGAPGTPGADAWSALNWKERSVATYSVKAEARMLRNHSLRSFQQAPIGGSSSVYSMRMAMSSVPRISSSS